MAEKRKGSAIHRHLELETAALERFANFELQRGVLVLEAVTSEVGCSLMEAITAMHDHGVLASGQRGID